MRFALLIVGLFSCAFSVFGQLIAIDRLEESAGLPDLYISALAVDAQGRLWVGTEYSGVYKLGLGVFSPVVEINRITGFAIEDIQEHEDGLYIRSNRGQFIYDGVRVRSHEGEPPASREVPLEISQGDSVNCAVEATLGGWLAGTDSGMYSVDPNDDTWIKLRDETGLLNARIADLVFDNKDRLWIATSGNGLLFRKNTAMSPARLDGAGWILANSQSRSIVFVQGDSLVMPGGRSRALPCIANEKDRIYLDANGAMWVACPDGSIYVLDGNSTSRAGNISVVDRPVFGSDEFGTVWVEDGGRFWQVQARYSGGYSLIEQHVALPDDQVVALIPAVNRLLCVGESGVGYIDGSRYNAAMEFPEPVNAAVLLGNGSLLIGSQTGKLYEVSGNLGQIRSISAPVTWGGRPVVFLDTYGETVFAGTDQGLYSMILNPADPLAPAEIVSLVRAAPGTYARNDFSSSAEEIFLADDRGALGIPKSGNPFRQGAPDVYLDKILAADGDMPAGADFNTGRSHANGQYGHTLPYRNNTLVVTWSASSLDAVTVNYQWKLEPLHREWTTPGTATQVQFASLPPGMYTFNLRACDDRGRCSSLVKPLVIEIGRAFWHFWWFWALISAMVVSFVALIWRRRLSYLRREAERESASLRARLQILELEQKALRLQMNPHFLANALQTIDNRLRKGSVDKVRNNLQDFGKLMRHVLNISRAEMVSLEDEIDFLRAYIAVENLVARNPVTCRITCDEAIQPFDIEIPVMLIQPLVENAIRHGGPCIEVDFRLKERLLEVIVADNGGGLPAGRALRGDAHALQILEERLQRIPGGRVGFRNLTDGETVCGLQVTLEIPLNS